MFSTTRLLIVLCVWAATLLPAGAAAQDRLRMATTTSTQASGLLDVLNPPFERKYGVSVDVIAVGTGKALRIAENGDVDMVFVHAPPAEMEFVCAGWGVDRLPVMHNDFVLIGPAGDPADLRHASSAADALKRIARSGATFVSRGDDSGTNKKEMALWKEAGIEPHGQWYLSTGQGMGAVLTISNDKQAYTLSDRGTYLHFKQKIELPILYEGDPALYNPYHVIAVNPEKHPEVNRELALRYMLFVAGPEGQKIISEYRVNGQQLFHPDVIRNP